MQNPHEAKPVKSIETNQYHSGRGSGGPGKKTSKVNTSTKRTNGNPPKLSR